MSDARREETLVFDIKLVVIQLIVVSHFFNNYSVIKNEIVYYPV